MTAGEHFDIIRWLGRHIFGNFNVVWVRGTIQQRGVNAAAFNKTVQGIDQVCQPNTNSKRVFQDCGKGVAEILLELVDIGWAVAWFGNQGLCVH